MSCKCLCAAIEYDIPDALREGPKTLHDLAIASGARPNRLGQIQRILVNENIFAYDAASDTYANNPTSKLLQSDHWTQWRNWVSLYGNEFYDMARGIPASCRKNAVRTPAQINYDTDMDMFHFFEKNGWLLKLHQTLSGGALAQAPGILEDYPWHELGDCTFLDLGGGGGGLVALLLRKYSTLRGGIFDLPKVIEHVKPKFLSQNGEFNDVGSRVAEENLIAGNFLNEIPTFEVYTMKWCLHDWDDDHALRILRNVRKAILKGPRARLVVLESILKDGRMGRLSRYGDITMMVSADGQERTELQWRNLARDSGWRINNIYPLRNSWTCAIELIPLYEVKRKVNGSDPLLSNRMIETISTIATGQPDQGLLESSNPQSRKIVSQMSYLEPWDESKGEPFFRSAPDEGFESTNLNWIDHDVVITDARPIKSSFSLDVYGFAFFEDTEGLNDKTIGHLQTDNKSLVQQLCYPRLEALVKKITGAPRIIIFDHTVRRRTPCMDAKQNPNGQEQPATIVSCFSNL